MREIKFRAWVISKATNKSWMNHEIEFVGGKINDIFASKGSSFADITYLQYTGLKDKNGVEIYEGDIVKGVDFKLHAEYVSQAKWHKNGYWYAFNKDGKGIGFLNNIELLEVIGNIYENPELLSNQDNSKTP